MLTSYPADFSLHCTMGKANGKRAIGILEHCLLFYSHPDGKFILVPYFNRTQIFQIDLSRSKKHILIFLFNFTAKYKKKRDELNSVKYFTQETGAQIFAKHKFQL